MLFLFLVVGLAAAEFTILYVEDEPLDGFRGSRQTTTNYCQTRDLFAELNCSSAVAFLEYEEDGILDFPQNHGVDWRLPVTNTVGLRYFDTWNQTLEPPQNPFLEGDYWFGALTRFACTSQGAYWRDAGSCRNGGVGYRYPEEVFPRNKRCTSLNLVYCVCNGGTPVGTPQPTTWGPTKSPTASKPTVSPTNYPTESPTTSAPSVSPTFSPSFAPADGFNTIQSVAGTFGPGQLVGIFNETTEDGAGGQNRPDFTSSEIVSRIPEKRLYLASVGLGFDESNTRNDVMGIYAESSGVRLTQANLYIPDSSLYPVGSYFIQGSVFLAELEDFAAVTFGSNSSRVYQGTKSMFAYTLPEVMDYAVFDVGSAPLPGGNWEEFYYISQGGLFSLNKSGGSNPPTLTGGGIRFDTDGWYLITMTSAFQPANPGENQNNRLTINCNFDIEGDFSGGVHFNDQYNYAGPSTVNDVYPTMNMFQLVYVPSVGRTCNLGVGSKKVQTTPDIGLRAYIAHLDQVETYIELWGSVSPGYFLPGDASGDFVYANSFFLPPERSAGANPPVFSGTGTNPATLTIQESGTYIMFSSLMCAFFRYGLPIKGPYSQQLSFAINGVEGFGMNTAIYREFMNLEAGEAGLQIMYISQLEVGDTIQMFSRVNPYDQQYLSPTIQHFKWAVLKV